MLDKTLEAIDSVFSDYLMKKLDSGAFEVKLGKTMSTLPLKNKKKFEVTIVNKNKKEEFFGFRIFPMIADMDYISNEIINEKISFNDLCKKWKNIENWYLEIDAHVFDRYEISFSPQELTAMLIHEVGHTIYSEKNMVIVYNAFKESQMRMRLADKASLKVLYTIYMIPLSVGCMQKNFVSGKNEISVEFYADSALKEYGYTESLINALDKIIKAYGSQNQSSSDKSKKIANSINWCNLNVTDLSRRKEKLKDELFYQSLKSESSYLKAVCFKVLNELGVKMRERYTGAVVEATIEMLDGGATYGEDNKSLYEVYEPFIDINVSSRLDRFAKMCRESVSYEAVTEGFRDRKTKTVKLPNQHRIDEIAIEIDRITNHHDRIYVLDLIYNIIEQLDLYEELYFDKPDFKRRDSAKIQIMRDQLESLRQATLAKKNLDKEYKFFVKYPQGYEG